MSARTVASLIRTRPVLSFSTSFNLRPICRVSPLSAPVRGFYSTPITRANVSTSEAVDLIEDDVVSLLRNEIEATSSDINERNDFKPAEDQFSDRGYSLKVSGNEVVATKEEFGRSVTLTWDPSFYPQENPEEINEGEEEDPEQENFNYETEDAIEVNALITKEGGKTLHLKFSVKNFQLTVDKIGMDTQSYLDLEDLSEELQDRIYDYLRELDIGEDTAELIQGYNRTHLTKEYLKSVEKVTKFFSRN